MSSSNNNNNYTATNDDLEPTLPPGMDDGSNGATVGGDDVSGQSDSESYVSFNWRLSCFLLLWIFGLIMLVFLMLRIYGYCYCRQQQQRQRGKKEYEEASPSSTRRQEDDDIEEICDQPGSPPAAVAATSLSLSNISIILMTTMCGFINSVVANTSCNFISPEDTAGISSLGLWKGELYLFTNQDPDLCFPTHSVPYFEEDWPQVFARIMALIASITGGICMLITLCILAYNFATTVVVDETSIKSTTLRIRRVTIPLLVTSVTQILTLTFLATQYCPYQSCSLGFGAVSSITATYFWLLSAIGTSYLPI
jgi:hypothetical protein